MERAGRRGEVVEDTQEAAPSIAGKRSRSETLAPAAKPASEAAGPPVKEGARAGIGDADDWLADVLDEPSAQTHGAAPADAVEEHTAEEPAQESAAEEPAPEQAAEEPAREQAAEGPAEEMAPAAPSSDGEGNAAGDADPGAAKTDADKADAKPDAAGADKDKAAEPAGGDKAADGGATDVSAGPGGAAAPDGKAAGDAVDGAGDDAAPEQAPVPTADDPTPEPETRAAVREAAGDIDEAVATESSNLGQAFAAKRDELAAEVQPQSDALIATSLTEYNTTITALAQREASVRAVFTVWRTNVDITRIGQAALARADASTAIERVTKGSSSIDKQLFDGAKAEGDRMIAAARTSSSKISGSGRELRAAVDAAAIGDLSAIAANIKPDEERAVSSAVAKAKQETKSGIIDEANKAHDKMYGGATKNAAAFQTAAERLVKKVGAKLPEHEEALRKTGEATATLIDNMAASQSARITAAERQVLAKIAEARAQAANVLHAGRIAAAALKTKVATQVAALHAQETKAKGQLQIAGAQVGGQLAKHKRMQRSQARVVVRHARGALREGAQQQTAALDGVTGPALAAVRAAPAGFAAAIGERRTLMLTGIDDALTAAGGLLATTVEELLGACIGFRMAANATYLTSEVQVAAGAQPEVEKAAGQWKSKADEFVASCVTYETEALDKHDQARAGLPAQMSKVAKRTVGHMRRTGWEKFKDGVATGLGRIAGGLKWFVLGVIAVAAVIVIFVAGIPIGLALAIAAAIVGIVMLAVGFVIALYTRFKMLWNNDWPLWAKILGIPATFGVAIGDVLGLSQLAEAIRGKELISDKELSDEERWARATEGLFQVITLGLARWFTKKPASAKRPPVADVPPPDAPPAEVAPPKPPRAGEPEAPGRRPAPEEPPPERRPTPDDVCFVAGTPVSTPAGPRAIESLRPGDTVLSIDIEGSGAVFTAVVLSCHRSDAAEVLALRAAGTVLRCTAAHPFWVPGRGWIAAGALHAGDDVFTREVGAAAIESIAVEPGQVDVYNIEVSGAHNYFVSSAQILVHNKAKRWNLQDRAAALEPRAKTALERAKELPESSPERAKLIAEAQKLQAEAEALSNKAVENGTTPESLEPQRSRIEALEEALGKLDEGLDTAGVAALPARARGLSHRVSKLKTEAEKLPDADPRKWQLLEEIRALEDEARTLRELADESPEAARSLEHDIEILEQRIRDAEARIKEAAPPDVGTSAAPRPHLEFPADNLPTGGKRPYVPPRRAGDPEVVRHPNGQGWLDERGNRWEWAHDQHGGPHWDVQHPNGMHTNVTPEGKVHQGADNF